MEIPRFRNEMKAFAWKGANYQQILKNLEDLLFSVKSQMIEEDLIPKTQKFIKEEQKR